MTEARPVLDGPPVAVGRMSVVVAAGGRVPDLPAEFREVRVDASTARGDLSALTVSDRVARALDPADGTPSGTWDRMRHGLRRTLLGDEPASHVGGTLLASLERLALVEGRPLVWVVERAHLADADSRGWLARQVRHMTRWPVAVVVGVAPEDPWGLGVAAQARRIWGDGAVWDVSGVRSSHPGAPEVEAATADVAVVEAVDASDPLSAEACVSLMAAAVVGSPFSLEIVSKLVGRSQAVVASHLQQAHLAGWHLTVDGPSLSLDPDSMVVLRAEVLPPVAAAWQAALIEAAEAEAEVVAEPVEETAVDTPRVRPSRPEDVVRELLVAAEDARHRGAWARASRHLELAAQRVHHLGDAGPMLAAETRLARARLAWSAAGQGVDLPVALAAAQAAEQELRELGGPAAAAEAGRLVAAIAHDIGDPAHLELALNALSSAIRDLRASGRPRDAARLLNDQAAVWVRLGNPVRAVHLLEESRRLFEAGTEPEDAHELAETLLLLARLPLHVPSRPGMGDAAVEQAVGHAQAAARIWTELDEERGVGLALETEGRLLLQGDRGAEALDRLQSALTALRHVRDALGLARVYDAMAHALVGVGQFEAGVRHLAESVRYNSAVGSNRGLTYNEASAHRLRARVPAGTPAEHALRDLLAAHVDARETARAGDGAREA